MRTLICIVFVFATASCLKASGKKENRSSGDVLPAEETPSAPVSPNSPNGTTSPQGVPPNDGLGDDEGSAQGNFKAKSKEVLESDIATALNLTANEICTELNGMNCFDKIHNIALGGVSAYDDGIFMPIAEPTVATAAAIERVALNACGRRAKLDMSGAPVVFVGIKKDSAGNVQDVASLKQSIVNLYERLLARSPTAAEVAALTDFYSQVKSSSQSAEKWARYSCLAVLTTTEFIFY
jgi:hypothetical protein